MSLSKTMKSYYNRKKKEIEDRLGMTIEEHREVEAKKRSKKLEDNIEELMKDWL